MSEKRDYVLGLDVGIASVGFALINNRKEESDKIIFSGVRIFEKAEVPKTGESLALPRRLKRSVRRIIRRKVVRIAKIQKLLRQKGLYEDHEKIATLDVWKLRDEVLTRRLLEKEFGAILLHIAKRRGFKSAKKIKKYNLDEVSDMTLEIKSSEANGKDKEKQKMLAGTRHLMEEMQKAGKETIGSYLASLPKKRNEAGSYERTVLRKLLEDEVDIIFDLQFKYGNSFATNELRDAYKEIAFKQNPMKSVADMVGNCEFEKNEKRASKATYTFERFRFLETFNRINLISKGDVIRLVDFTDEDVEDMALNKGRFTYKDLRKKLKIDYEKKFNLVDYNIPLDEWKKFNALSPEEKEKENKNIIDKIEGKKVAFDFKATTALRKAISKIDESVWNELFENTDKLDKLATVLSVEKDEDKIKKILMENFCFNEDIADALLDKTFDKFGNLSLVAMKKIIPGLEEGLTYDKACLKAGYKHSDSLGDNGDKEILPKFQDIRNPVVNRALSQTRKVINACIREYGKPKAIYVELARDLGKSFKDRMEIKKRNDKNEEERKNMMSECRKEHSEELAGRELTRLEMIKFRLWKEQKFMCPYSGEKISFEECILNDNAVQVDHILPYSRSFDDSYNNKVLVKTKANQEKGNNTPYEWIGHDPHRWQLFEEIVKDFPYKKKQNLLRKHFAEDEEGFKERNINDTRYIARELSNHIRKHLKFEGSVEGENKQHVFVRNGQLTAMLRKLWGLHKDRSANDKHHAQDAIVVATCNQATKMWLEKYHKDKKDFLITKERFPMPWEFFREDVMNSVNDVFVSRMPRRKVSGSAHEDTIRSLRTEENGDSVILQRKRIIDLKKEDIKNIYQARRNKKLCKALLERFDACGTTEGKIAFKEPIFMPTKSGKQGPQIKSVTVVTNEKSGLVLEKGSKNDLRKAIASNGSMIRIDVFEKEKKFYAIPIYVADIVKKELPSKAIVSGKDEANWVQIDDTFKFKFSLYPNDYIKVVTAKGEEIEGYYIKADRSNASITYELADGSDKNNKSTLRIGIKTLKSFEKYNVDVLGRHISRIKSEKRNGLEKCINQQSRKSKARE